MNVVFWKRVGRSVLVPCFAAAIGCASKAPPSQPPQAPPPPIAPYVESGFLTDYTQLQQVEPGSLRRTYRNPDVDFARYPKLLFDRITLWRDTEDVEDVESADFQTVANDLYASITNALGGSFTLVTRPGPGVARIRLALSDVDEPDDQLDVYVTDAEPVTIDPEAMLPAGLIEFGRGAWMEAEILDSTNETLIFAVVDRAGDVIPRAAPIKTWGDLHASFVAWGEKIARALNEARRPASG